MAPDLEDDTRILRINADLAAAMDPDEEGWREAALRAVSEMRALGLGVRVLRALERDSGAADPAQDPDGFRAAHTDEPTPSLSGGSAVSQDLLTEAGSRRATKTLTLIDASREVHARVVVPFGKHRGRTLGEIASEDPGYIDWLAQKHAEGGTRPPEIGEAASKLLSSP